MYVFSHPLSYWYKTKKVYHSLLCHALLIGFLWFLLGLQLSRGPWGPAGQEDRAAGGPKSSEPGGLRHREWRLWRRIHDHGLRVCACQRRHWLWGGLPIRRRGKTATTFKWAGHLWAKFLPKQTFSHSNLHGSCDCGIKPWDSCHVLTLFPFSYCNILFYGYKPQLEQSS